MKLGNEGKRENKQKQLELASSQAGVEPVLMWNLFLIGGSTNKVPSLGLMISKVPISAVWVSFFLGNEVPDSMYF